MIQSIIFILVLALVGFISFKKYGEIYRNIKRGKDLEISDNKGQRFKNTLLIAFGQKKMFKRWVPAVFHFFIYAAFIITQIELIEIFVDGIFGTHRVFRPFLGGFYTFTISFIEILSVLAFVATLIFLIRRNLLVIPRFHKDEMTGWPKFDGNLILYAEIWLLFCIACMNGADEVLFNLGKTHAEGVQDTAGSFGFAVSQFLGPAMFSKMSVGMLEFTERFGWWGHILGVLGFLVYLPFSKHLHVMLAFPNVYFADLNPKGKMTNMPAIQAEVASMMDPDAAFADDGGADMEQEMPSFGAKDVEDLTWKNLMDAYTCTECGRCTSNCPANQTGKALSPRKIMMDVRDRMEDKTAFEKENGVGTDDGKTLFDYISKEEINACTTCNACVEACPVMINPLNIITELRRHKIMDQADSTEEWNLMFTNTENNGAVWQFSPQDRAKWVEEVE